ncbi:hypothetical protein CkaCkLH20_00796 [Colletotrichum karsti]|uniref:Uncharacterized protein n=1 Tax=Colletotrichum karsti TaxID=1095194 RepID=A0A9P6IJI4_9PEZI|nr:uncharacterized protein CkaCkLH20_00796 [Colletotrichum karsti]KAF9881650.1 hypothetical protein CkaCkLH20_00796 [Colletotrichum karsti]
MQISQPSLLRSLEGVANATKSSESETISIRAWITSNNDPDCSSFEDWKLSLDTASKQYIKGDRQFHIASLTLLVSFLRESSRHDQVVSPSDLSQCWDMVRNAAMFDDGASRGLFTASRSAQGFLAIPLCSLVKDGNLDELIRVHVWMPDGMRGNPDFAVHSHQPFAQSWILAGEGLDHSYEVEPVTNTNDATHAKFALAWSGSDAQSKSHDKTYTAHQTYSIVENTGELRKATEISSELHETNTTYSIPAAAFHRSEVSPDSLHATFFFFDAHRGFVKDAGVLGPPKGDSFKQYRDPAGITALELIQAVDAVRSWEALMEEGRKHAQKTDWEDALRAFNKAISLCSPEKAFPNANLYEHLVLGEIGCTNRRFGRYDAARAYLEKAISGLRPCIQRVEFSGELGVTYRHAGLLEDAAAAFTQQYETAEELGSEREICRAIGNMGMVNFQLSQQKNDSELLDLAISQLRERVDRAESLLKSIGKEPSSASSRRWSNVAATWKTIGLCRLSICHYARGDVQEAIETSKEALQMTSTSNDATVKAMTRFFHGRALLMAERRKEAQSLFNVPETCSPAIAFAKEPSEEHRGYLQELVDHGANFDIVDEQGYTAIDYAVFNGDELAESIILEGLRKNAEDGIKERRAEARLRKGYRELFQERLRPVLVGGGPDVLSELRKAYALALETDAAKRSRFDVLKFMWFSDFCNFGKLPRSSDGSVREFNSASSNAQEPEITAEKMIFISYRWINKDTESNSPDDAKHTQYRRMLSAIEEYLELNPTVNRKTLGIWMDFACVNQDDPDAGVAALPMIIAQCDAMISLYDDEYYDRAWCAVEVMMAETLRSAYGIHQWYEHVGGSGENTLGKGLRVAKDRGLGMKSKRLTFETDRPKVLFLERQSKLLR